MFKFVGISQKTKLSTIINTYTLRLKKKKNNAKKQPIFRNKGQTEGTFPEVVFGSQYFTARARCSDFYTRVCQFLIVNLGHHSSLLISQKCQVPLCPTPSHVPSLLTSFV